MDFAAATPPGIHREASGQVTKNGVLLHLADNRFSIAKKPPSGDEDFANKGKEMREALLPGAMGQIVPWQSRMRPSRLFCPEMGNGR